MYLNPIFILSLALAFSFGTFAQTPIQIIRGDMPVAGGIYLNSYANPLNFTNMDFESTGMNYTWDFRSLSYENQIADTFKSLQSVGGAYAFIFAGAASYAVQDHSTGGGTGISSGVLNFYNNLLKSYSNSGFGFNFGGISIPVRFQTHDTLYHFPLNFSDSDTSFASYSMSVPFMGYGEGTIKRRNTVDGWGTLRTPYGDFQTLRVKSESWRTDSLYMDTLGFGFRIPEIHSIEYKWLAKNIGVPLLTVTKSDETGISLTSSIVYRDSMRVSSNRLISSTKNSELKMFPNPSNGKITFTLPFDIKHSAVLTIINTEGKVVKQLYPATQKILIDLSDLPKGLYAVVFYDDTSMHSGSILLK
jgi:hypothetical protein